MRLIDADGLLQVIRKNIPKNPHDEYQEGQEIGLSMAVEMVCNEPTVDAEPVIRCKDCKYFSQNDRWCKRYECGDGDRLICWDLGEDGFCSRGEKK